MIGRIPAACVDGADARDLEIEIEIRRFPAALALAFKVSEGVAELAVTLGVMDRDTGERTTIVSRDRQRMPFVDHAHASYWVRHVVTRALLHEFDECFYVDGVRVRDPHAAGRSL